jgi:hypothetical protein
MNQIVTFSHAISYLSGLDELFLHRENCAELNLILLLKVFFPPLEK